MRVMPFGLVCAAALTGCYHPPANGIQCDQSSNCDLSPGGTCLASSPTGNRWCAYPDPSCPGGYRYSNVDTGDGLSGECVPDNQDAGVDGPTRDAPHDAPPHDSAPDGPMPDASPANFVVTYGGTGGERVKAVYGVSDGYIFTGSLASNSMIGTYPVTYGGGLDYVIAKLKANGDVAWVRAQNSVNQEDLEGGGVSPAGDVIVAGSFTGSVDFGGATLNSAGGYDIFLAKYSGSDGTRAWSVRYGGTNDERVQAAAVDSAGDVYVAGYFATTANIGGANLTSAGGEDIFVAKYSGSDGSYLWGFRAGGTGDDYPAAIAVDATRVTVGGRFRNTVNFGGNNLVSKGADDIFMAAFNRTNGNHVWSESFGSSQATSNDSCSALAVVGGAVFLTGGFVAPIDFGSGTAIASQGSSDVYVAKYDAATGSYIWAKGFGGPMIDVANGLAGDGTAIAVTGSFEQAIDFGGGPLSSAGGDDIFVADLSQADGSYVSAFRSGGANSDGGTALSTGPTGLVVGGYFSGVTYFGTTQETSGGGTDGFVFAP